MVLLNEAGRNETSKKMMIVMSLLNILYVLCWC